MLIAAQGEITQTCCPSSKQYEGQEYQDKTSTLRHLLTKVAQELACYLLLKLGTVWGLENHDSGRPNYMHGKCYFGEWHLASRLGLLIKTPIWKRLHSGEKNPGWIYLSQVRQQRHGPLIASTALSLPLHWIFWAATNGCLFVAQFLWKPLQRSCVQRNAEEDIFYHRAFVGKGSNLGHRSSPPERLSWGRDM